MLLVVLFSNLSKFCSGTNTAGPITYKVLKESLAPRTEPRKDSYEDDELDAEFFKPFEGGELEHEDVCEVVPESDPDYKTGMETRFI